MKPGTRAPRVILLAFATAAMLSGTPNRAAAADPAEAPATPAATPSAPATPQQRVATMKQWLAASQSQLRNYEWIETTTVSVGGEEKSRQQHRCYYGVDGKLQKVPVGAAEQQEAPRGPLRRHVVEKKRQELTDYMQSAIGLIHQYIPPNPEQIQSTVNGGRMSVNMVEPGRVARLDFADYLKPGDKLAISVEVPTNRLLAIDVTSHLESPEDTVRLDVGMNVLPDGTLFAERSTLNAPAKDLTVTVENSGYRRAGG